VSSLIGLINGFLVVKGRMNGFMVTLAMLILLLGLAMVVSQARNVTGLAEGFRYIGYATIGRVPVSVLFMLVVFVIMGVVLSRTVFGSNLYAVGGNRLAARAAGINDDRVIMSAYVLSGFFSGLSSFILVGRIGTVGVGISTSALFPVIAAAVIGGISIYGGRGGVVGMVGGLLLIGIITNALNLVAIPSEWVRVVTGFIILVALSIDAFKRRGQITE